jgi:hypothetical protein
MLYQNSGNVVPPTLNICNSNLSTKECEIFLTDATLQHIWVSSHEMYFTVANIQTFEG